jgi:hypothetical protein
MSSFETGGVKDMPTVNLAVAGANTVGLLYIVGIATNK